MTIGPQTSGTGREPSTAPERDGNWVGLNVKRDTKLSKTGSRDIISAFLIWTSSRPQFGRRSQGPVTSSERIRTADEPLGSIHREVLERAGLSTARRCYRLEDTIGKLRHSEILHCQGKSMAEPIH